MKIKRKHLFSISSSLLIISSLTTLTVSCSRNIANSNIKDVDNFIDNIKIKLKDDKKDQKNQTLASTISTEEQVKDWFDGLPQSNNEINVKFISSLPLSTNKTILEIKYEISKGSISKEFKHLEEGFLDESSSNKDENDVKDFISKLKPSIKTDKQNQKANTLASTISTEEQVKQWFDGLPESNSEINVKFISSKPNKNIDSILEVIYTISKGSYSLDYSFLESGFKSEQKGITFKEFSEKNSFRITFQISDKYTNDEGQQTFHKNNGTAWSWYYKKNSDFLYDWYLMTNFHVVTNTVAYTNGFLKLNEGNNSLSLKDHNALIDFYKKNITTNFNIDKSFFELLTYSDDEKYKSLIRINESENAPSNSNFISKEVVKSINIITDFNNDSIDLFSKSDQTKNVLYNLDMALVKISLDFSKHKDYLKTEYQRPNVVSKYLSNPNLYNETKFSKSKWTSIGGHPRIQDKLILTNIGPNFYLDYKNLDIFDFVLTALKAPYYYTTAAMNNFLLTAGASGSAAYQLQDQALNSINENEIPIGIFWGGQNVLSINPNDFIPSVIPFITDEPTAVTYNVFENFKNSGFF